MRFIEVSTKLAISQTKLVCRQSNNYTVDEIKHDVQCSGCFHSEILCRFTMKINKNSDTDSVYDARLHESYFSSAMYNKILRIICIPIKTTITY